MRLITVLIILIVGLLLIKHLCNNHTNNRYFFNISKSLNNMLYLNDNTKRLSAQSNLVSVQQPLSAQSNLVSVQQPSLVGQSNLVSVQQPLSAQSNLVPVSTQSNLVPVQQPSLVGQSNLSNKDTLSNVNKNLSTYELVGLIHDQSMISIPNHFDDSRKKPSFDIKDITIGKERTKYSTQETDGYDNRKLPGTDFDNYPNQYDIMNDNTIKSVLQNINPDTFMVNDNDNMYVSENNIFSDRYAELENKQVVKNKRKILDIPTEITVSSKPFNLLGIAYNEYYNQYYLIYEHVLKTSNDNNYLEDNLNNLSNQVAEYVLAKIRDNKNIEIVHEISPRNKINYNEVVYLSYGNFQLGPLLVKNI